MTTLDFPVAPLVGDRFPTPSVAGMPQYIWDGEKWTTAANTITTAPPSTGMPLEDNATPQIGVTTKYAREDHVHPSTALKYSAQSLTTTQQSQSRKNMYAAPFDAQAYSGLQVNGSCEISQERNVGTWVNANGYAIDGWELKSAGTAAVNLGAYSAPSFNPGFTNWLVLGTTVAQATINAADYFMIWHKIEGYRIARLGWGTATAKPITIGFWSRHTTTGIYSVTVRNQASNRGYAATYIQTSSDASQYNVITVPGDTSGTWLADNASGITLTFAVAMGSSNIASAADTWIATACAAAPGQVNGVSSTSSVFRITGVVVLPGIEAPSAERSPLIMRPYDQELLACQRYYLKMPIGINRVLRRWKQLGWLAEPAVQGGNARDTYNSYKDCADRRELHIYPERRQYV